MVTVDQTFQRLLIVVNTDGLIPKTLHPNPITLLQIERMFVCALNIRS